MKPDFYEFGIKFYSAPFQAHEISLPVDQLNGYWAADRLIMGDYNNIEFPVIFIHAQGKKMYDVLNTGWPSLHLISNQMKQTLEKNHLSGWQTFPIKLLEKKGKEIGGYYGLTVTGRSGPKNFNESSVIYKRRTEHAVLRKFYRGYQINEWDGSDFFIPRGSLQIIISQRAAILINENRLTNISTKNISEVEMSEDIVRSAMEKSDSSSEITPSS